jgi:hypothetical protein
VCDFGLSKEGVASATKSTYTMCGTPEYQVRDKRQLHNSTIAV